MYWTSDATPVSEMNSLLNSHIPFISHTCVFNSHRYYWPLRSLPSRLGSKQIDFRKRIPFCFCGKILQYCGLKLCFLELCGWFIGALGWEGGGCEGEGFFAHNPTPHFNRKGSALICFMYLESPSVFFWMRDNVALKRNFEKNSCFCSKGKEFL